MQRLRKIYLKDQFQVTLTDTVGFYQDLPTELVAALLSQLLKKVVMWTFFCMSLMRVILITKEQKEVVLDILKDLDMTDIPGLAIYSKMDVADNLVATVFPNVRLSAVTKGKS